MEHDRAYHRFKDKVKQERKMNIIKSYGDSWRKLLNNPAYVGKLVKGKLHCSCFMCNGGDKRKVLGPKISEIKKIKIEE